MNPARTVDKTLEIRHKPASRWQRSMLGELLRLPQGFFGAAVLVALILVAVFADSISPIHPYFQDYDAVLSGPTLEHPMGTDDIGRDVLSRVIHGARISLYVSILSVLGGGVIGIVMGLISGFFGGWLDEMIMRLNDALWSFPALLLALAIAAALGGGTDKAILAIAVVGIPGFARLVRAQTLSVREMEYVTAARATGAGSFRLMLRHIWPNVTSPIIVHGSISMGGAILSEASLSFLGAGAQPPEPSWGMMLRQGYHLIGVSPWVSIFPGVAVFLAVLGMNLLGDALQAVMDPRLRRKH